MEWTPGPVLLPASPMEEFGIEDPRIVEIDETYWITYVAVSRHGVATALASTHDFVTFERHGVVFFHEGNCLQPCVEQNRITDRKKNCASLVPSNVE